MAAIRLLILDFDGTLLGHDDEFPIYPRFRERIQELKNRHGTLWAVSTGRSPRGFWTYFAGLRLVGLEPDFVVTEHAYIARRTRWGYVPHVLWNLRTAWLLLSHRARIRAALDEWHKVVVSGIRDTHTLLREKDRLCLRFNTQEAADVAAEMLRERAAARPHLMVFKYLTEVDVRSVPFTKGLAVSELARHLRISPAETLVIGNGHNDISMLKDEVAGMVGCPVNSEAEVMELVHQRGGHISESAALAGVLDVLDAYLNGAVRSGLPSWWKPPSGRPNPRPAKRRRHQRHYASPKSVGRRLFFGILAVTVIVLAHFGVIPFSDRIMRPVQWVVDRVVGLLSWGLGR